MDSLGAGSPAQFWDSAPSSTAPAAQTKGFLPPSDRYLRYHYGTEEPWVITVRWGWESLLGSVCGTGW
eukprot:3790250-Pyramimonas_sp.AAC.1